MKIKRKRTKTHNIKKKEIIINKYVYVWFHAMSARQVFILSNRTFLVKSNHKLNKVMLNAKLIAVE